MNSQPRLRACRPGCLVFVVCLAIASMGSLRPAFSFAGGLSEHHSRASATALKAGLLDGFNTKAMEELMNDEEKLKEMQQKMQEVMEDPEKAKQIQAWQAQSQAAVKKLEEDPEMKEFFDDVKANGLKALEKYENNEEVLAKFSQAMGGPQSMMAMGGMGGMPGMAGMGAAAPPAKSFNPGDEVIINGLAKAPELNGKKAMVVPPTAEEKKTLEGTNRLIVRLIDTGDQFAVKPENLRTTAQEVDAVMSNDIEDIAFSNPALQTEAAKLRDSGKLDDVANDPELKPIFEDIKKNGMAALEKYWNDEEVMKKINKAMAAGAIR